MGFSNRPSHSPTDRLLVTTKLDARRLLSMSSYRSADFWALKWWSPRSSRIGRSGVPRQAFLPIHVGVNYYPPSSFGVPEHDVGPWISRRAKTPAEVSFPAYVPQGLWAQ